LVIGWGALALRRWAADTRVETVFALLTPFAAFWVLKRPSHAQDVEARGELPADAMPGEAATGWLAHRLRLGVTEGVAELGTGETLWLEANARELHGVSFTKGCYVGQENTARMHHRAKVSRRLVVAPLHDQPGGTAATFRDLNLMVERRRVDALGDALIPPWLAAAL
uniref:CAF17-like 4Fe-4S cluster assembly/insertion protein YgfZ n=1 Tax=Sphingomonas bacterium TaxID=1895847 RepID=UPI0015762D8F